MRETTIMFAYPCHICCVFMLISPKVVNSCANAIQNLFTTVKQIRFINNTNCVPPATIT